MRRHFNIDSGTIQEQGGSGYASAIPSLTVRRHDTPILQIGAVLESEANNLDLGAGVSPDVKLVVKKKEGEQRFEEAPVLKHTVFTKSTVGGQIYYAGAVPIFGDIIDEDLGVGPDKVDVAEVTYSAQISLLYQGGRQTSQWFDFVVQNNYDRDDDAVAPAADVRVRHAEVSIPNGQSYLEVEFETPMPTADWVLRSHFVTCSDATPLNLFPGLITNRTEAGFTVQFNGATDTANYLYAYTCDQS